MERKKYIKEIKRIVVKIGSSSLTVKGEGLNISNMKKFTSEVDGLIKKGIKVVIVTSGAIAAGLQSLSISSRPKDISVLQAAASVGQVELMRTYGKLFARYGLKIGQILLTREDTTRRKQYINITNTIENLLKLETIPVINENDSVAVEEIKFGDNDRLAALVSSITDADLLAILSDIDGLYDRNPQKDPSARLISFVEKITKSIEQLAEGVGSAYSSGGMRSKIRAARICSFSGIPMIIANSKEPDILNRIVNFEPVGTFFAPQQGKKVRSVKRWIAFGVQSRGSIYIDDGAADAINTGGKSILPVGVIDLKGNFKKGDTLDVFSPGGILIAKGISSLSSVELSKVKGKSNKDLSMGSGSVVCSEVIHRDSLVVFGNNECQV
jgi:glutamate 5-kinase